MIAPVEDHDRLSSCPDHGVRALIRLNAVRIDADQISGGIGALWGLPSYARNSAGARRVALMAWMSACPPADRDGVVEALAVRIAALDRWTAAHDPEGLSDADAAIEAAARHALAEQPDGIGFDPVSFGELVGFVEEMPF
jgi:hypothetical protein